ncbi:MAG: GatB/YqeY domain-containing protein [Nevskiaceae bacterium]|nr:MAG: GatB/YqeY domain-containing protein [Nevskiaceae bacterium]TBR75011.1 MAG: GatB/YqeY domain-containing protein [Nevskiaceae bacterium]
MTSELKPRIAEDTKTAMRAHDKVTLGVLRLLSAAIKQREVDEHIVLDDPAVIGVIEKMVKQRRDSVAQYTQGGRPELAAAEQAEIEKLSAYLPRALSDAEIAALITQAKAATGAASIKDMGKIMAWLKPQVAGRTDMGKLSGRVKAQLG